MKTKIWLSLLLSTALLLTLLTGCGDAAGSSLASTESQQSAEQAVSSAGEADSAGAVSAEESDTAPDVSSIVASTSASEPEPAAPDGTVLSKEECVKLGYDDVMYGMYDFGAYIELPIVEEDNEPLGFWTMVQPYMTSYGVDMTNVTYFREMHKRTGVNVEVTAASFFTVTEAFSLIIASGDIPDMMDSVGSYYTGGLAVAIEEEVFQDVAPLIDQYMPNLKGWLDTYPDYRAEVTELNGVITTAPGFGNGQPWNVGIQIRQDWLDELQMETPVTYDDYYEVLKAFKSNYGATLWVDGNATSRENCYSAGYEAALPGDQSAAMLSFDGESAVFSPVTDQCREYLTTLHKWYDEGLVYADFATQANISTPDSSIVSNGSVGIWVSDADTMVTYDQLGDGIEVNAAPHMRKTEDQTIHMYMASPSTGEGISIAAGCSNVELCCKWLDYNYTYDGYLLTCYGVEGEGLEFDENGNPGLTDLILNNPDMIVVACIATYAKYNGAGVFDVERFTKGYTQKQHDCCEVWTTNVDNAYGDVKSKLTTDQSARAATLMADISTYAEQAILQFVVGELSLDDDWDSYVEYIYSLGLDEYYEIQEAGHEQYLSLME